jgi:ribosomal protein S18 acetylase RimI-like enzyme
MTEARQHNLVKKRTLTTEELVAIQQLTELCNRHDKLYMRLDWNLLANRSGAEVSDFLYYQNDELVGYLNAYGFGNDERELTGMVHPAQRRQGIARTLLQAAREEYTGHGVHELLLICEQRSTSGKAFVEAVGAHHAFSEHEMVLTHFQPRNQFDDRLAFRSADISDIPALATIMSTTEGTLVEVEESAIQQRIQDPTNHYYIAIFGDNEVGCHEPVGMLRLNEMDDEIGIYSFAVIPDYQGRGYGRQMLEEAIYAVRADQGQKTIMLDVDTTNERALQLYRSCGFDIKTTYDYYSITLA